MAHYDIFREQLEIRYPAYGHALWEPRPGSLYSPVEVGDVGYVREGAFHRLFNALLAADHPSHDKFGVPEYHVPLVHTPPEHINIGTLNPSHYCSHGITVTTAEPDFHATPDDLPQVSYQCTRKQRGGAVSFLPVPAQRQDTIARGAFGRWMIKHIELWLDFTRRLGLGIEQMEDIILITGCHRTRSWANVAFLESHTDSQVSLGVEVTDPGGPGMNITWRFSPERVQGAVLSMGPGGKNLPEDQCVFIRGFRVTRTLRILPKHLIAAAEPSSDSDEHSNDPDYIELTSIPNITKYRDPLHILLEHLAERAPDCDMVLVHDDDLARIAGIYDSDEAFQTDTIVCLIHQSQPEIQQVQCDLLCVGESSSTTTAEATTVAMSSAEFQTWGEPCISRNLKGHIEVRNPLSRDVRLPTLQPGLLPSDPSSPARPAHQQGPALRNVRICTAQDALQVFFAVARNVLTLLTRRLDADQRKAIRSGNVYIWEERSASTVNSGLTMERWTDGMGWGPPRIRDEFLFYSQKVPAQERLPSSGGRMSFPLQDNRDDRLIKQTYSVYVFLPEDKGQDIIRKWHLTAYWNRSTLGDLARIDDVPDVGRIPIPEGLFKSARETKTKRDDPRPSTLGMPTRSEAYYPSSLYTSPGVLGPIFPSSGDEPQTAHAFTQDGPSWSHTVAPPPPEPTKLS